MNKLKIALQKAGRLHEESIKLLKACGINLKLDLNKLKISTCLLDIFFLRDDDIPNYVQDGIADIGIVGKNVVSELDKEFLIKEYLGFGYCRLSLAVPKGSRYRSFKDLSGKCIASSHPKILDNFLKKKNIYCYIQKIRGSVEIAPNIGVSDAICDLVSSGRTLESNDLKELNTIFSSEAVLLCNPKSNQVAENLIFRIKAVKRARENNYLIFNAPKKKLNTILSVIKKHKSCKILHILPIPYFRAYVQVIVPAFIIWKILDELKKNSAKDLMVLPIKIYQTHIKTHIHINLF